MRRKCGWAKEDRTYAGVQCEFEEEGNMCSQSDHFDVCAMEAYEEMKEDKE